MAINVFVKRDGRRYQHIYRQEKTMSNKHHRVGVNELNLVIRHLRLTGVTADNLDLIVRDIDSQPSALMQCPLKSHPTRFILVMMRRIVNWMASRI